MELVKKGFCCAHEINNELRGLAFVVKVAFSSAFHALGDSTALGVRVDSFTSII